MPTIIVFLAFPPRIHDDNPGATVRSLAPDRLVPVGGGVSGSPIFCGRLGQLPLTEPHACVHVPAFFPASPENKL